MSIVIVCSPDKLHSAIGDVDKENRKDDSIKRWIAPVLTEFFLNAEQSKPLLVSSINIYSFTYETFTQRFQEWIDEEIKNNPEDKEKIENVGKIILDMFGSEWVIDNGLVVRELL